MLSPRYRPQEIEKKWSAHWAQARLFASAPHPHKKAYTVLMPPPNITGILHMGHVLNNTLQDVLVRKARMQGREACWVPGIDHASIATEAKVVALLREQGIRKEDIGREAFLQHAWAWKEKYGGIILEQMRQLGLSCDWNRVCFTLDAVPSAAVQQVFIDLYRKGHIYRGTQMIHWDPQARTALSDEEVMHEEVEAKLYHIRYPLEKEGASLAIATTRPETIMADAALCVHPQDDRYRHLLGQYARIPLLQRRIPIIADDYVVPTFGTGCLKVTPAHDMNDHLIGQRHGLETRNILHEDGTLNDAAELFVGEDRLSARKKIVQRLADEGYLLKTEAIKHTIGLSERTRAIVEPRLSQQWFCRMQALATPAIESVKQQHIRFYPAKLKNLYLHWMENIKDWCISRQLWWGHRIPAWYDADGAYVIAATAQEAVAAFAQKNLHHKAEDLRQDEDVLDTWFSSWLWPLSVFDGLRQPNNPDIRYYYPTQDLVTAPEIIFFWVARMIMAGHAYRQAPPFENVYFTGIVRDAKRQKMSKSLGNSPDPVSLMERYGADSVRIGMLLCAPAGQDLLFDESLCEQGRNFANKLWNALRLITSWNVDAHQDPNKKAASATAWFSARLGQAIHDTDKLYHAFRLSDVAMYCYKLIWEDFCNAYLEMIKPDKGQPIDAKTLSETKHFYETLLTLLHPFMPFITEEIRQRLHEMDSSASATCLAVTPYPAQKPYDAKLLEEMAHVLRLIHESRRIIAGLRVDKKSVDTLYIRTKTPERYKASFPLIRRLLSLRHLAFSKERIPQAQAYALGTDECFLPVPTAPSPEQKARSEKQLQHLHTFLEQVMEKLENTQFTTHAPEQIVLRERKKAQDIQEKIKTLEKLKQTSTD